MSTPTDPECIFCKIVAGEIPATVVHRTETAVAFRDISPQAPVHVLVVPHRHEPNAAALADAAPSDVAELVRVAGAVAAEEGYPDDYRLVFNTGAGAGQTVFHAHLHVLAGGRFGERLT